MTLLVAGAHLPHVWIQVDKVKLDEGPDLSPSGGTRLEVAFPKIPGLFLAQEVDLASQDINFTYGYPLMLAERFEFTVVNP